MPLLKLLQEQRQFSVATFGPEPRLAGVLDHLEKELAEVQEATGDVMEWADCFLLCIDGSMRAGGDPSNIVAYLTSSPTFALRVSGGGSPLLGDSCSRSTGFLLHRAA